MGAQSGTNGLCQEQQAVSPEMGFAMCRPVRDAFRPLLGSFGDLRKMTVHRLKAGQATLIHF